VVEHKIRYFENESEMASSAVLDIEFHYMDKNIRDIAQNDFCAPQKKEMHTDLEQHGRVNNKWLLSELST